MKKIISILICGLLLITSCASSKIIGGKEFAPYGVINRQEVKDETIEYKRKKGAVFCSILLFETIFAPIVILGFKLYEPVKKKE